MDFIYIHIYNACVCTSTRSLSIFFLPKAARYRHARLLRDATRNGVANFRNEFLSFPRNLRRLFDAIGNKGIIRRIILIQEISREGDPLRILAVSDRIICNATRVHTDAEDTDGILKGGQFRGRVEPFETSCCPGATVWRRKEGRKENGRREERSGIVGRWPQFWKAQVGWRGRSGHGVDHDVCSSSV